MAIFTNMSGAKSVRNAFCKYSNDISTLNIASAFFSYSDVLEELAKKGVQINLVVRLSPATNANSLLSLIKYDNVCIRAYTVDSFHPKLYIFGDDVALLGSANMTNSGFNSNQEISITVDSNNFEFDELVSIFSSYWGHAKALNKSDIEEYGNLLSKYSGGKPADTVEKEIKNCFGEVKPPSEIVSNNKKKNLSEVYIQDYDRKYQEFLRSYNKITKSYSSLGIRKIKNTPMPIRIEIDQFLNYIRGELTEKESYNDSPIRNDDELNVFVQSVAKEWFSADFPYIDTVANKYIEISERFKSIESIDKLSSDEIFETLYICHAFAEQMRHHLGGKPTFKKAFITKNPEDKIKETIKYLLFGKDKITTRMARCIFGSYKLEHMGRNSVQEIIGWVNHEGIPICNSRTLKALRYLGAIEGRY